MYVWYACDVHAKILSPVQIIQLSACKKVEKSLYIPSNLYYNS